MKYVNVVCDLFVGNILTFIGCISYLFFGIIHEITVLVAATSEYSEAKLVIKQPSYSVWERIRLLKGLINRISRSDR